MDAHERVRRARLPNRLVFVVERVSNERCNARFFGVNVCAVAPLSFVTRVWFSYLCWFRILFDGGFAARVWQLHFGKELTEPHVRPELPTPPPLQLPAKVAPPRPRTDAALQFLAVLQREGRLIDFLTQDVAAFSDGDVGAAARVVHQGCSKALRDHATVEPILHEEEGVRIAVTREQLPMVKLVGNVQGQAPYQGTVRHQGWRISKLSLAEPVGDVDLSIVAPAEVEL